MPIDYNRYPQDWKTRLNRILWERAAGLCENCGLPHKAIVWSYKEPRRRGTKLVYRVHWLHQQERPYIKGVKRVRVILTKAHMDHDPENKHVNPSRLRLWCQLCHLRYDALPKAQKRRQAQQRPAPGQLSIGLS